MATVTDWDDGLILTQDWCREVAVGERGTLSFFTSSGRGILYLLMQGYKYTSGELHVHISKMLTPRYF